MSTSRPETAFLFDVDNTLLDNALDPKNLADYSTADISFESIGDLLEYELAQLLNQEHLK